MISLILTSGFWTFIAFSWTGHSYTNDNILILNKILFYKKKKKLLSKSLDHLRSRVGIQSLIRLILQRCSPLQVFWIIACPWGSRCFSYPCQWLNDTLTNNPYIYNLWYPCLLVLSCLDLSLDSCPNPFC